MSFSPPFRPNSAAAFEAAAREAGVAVTDVGVATEGDQPPRFMLRGRETRFGRGSFSHF